MNVNIENVIALREAFNNVKKRHKTKALPDFDERKKRLIAVRQASVGNEELLEKAVESLKSNGITVHLAGTKEEALEIIVEEIGDEKFVVKSKSNVTKEIKLAKELEKRGIKAIETDIGDRIAQLLNASPSHPTGPIAHLSAREIAEGLREKYGFKAGDSPEEIVQFIKEDILKSFAKAKVGITGANAITAEEGSIVMAHNEGNIFATMRKEKHIVVTGIDKIYLNLEEAMNMLKILTYNATGAFIPSFVEVVSGVSKTADVEKKFFAGVHNPKEIVLVLLNNGRSEIINNGFRELLYCIGCGNCLIYCPMYNAIGNEYAKDNNLGGRGLALHAALTSNREEKLELCLTCGKCKINCPVAIDIPRTIRKLRSDNLLYEAGYFLKSHLIWLYYNLAILRHHHTSNKIQ